MMHCKHEHAFLGEINYVEELITTADAQNAYLLLLDKLQVS
jgi:hypothetical protein